MKLAPAVLAILLVAAGTSGATNRYYGDQTVKSPSGTLRLEAKSPDNAGKRPAPFAASFKYTLFDDKSGKELWSREQPMKTDESGWKHPDGEGSPVSIWITDRGQVVVYTGYQELLLLEPEKGDKVFQGDVLKQFREEDRRLYVHNTTAGPMWGWHSRWYFLSCDKGEYFVIRPWWGARVYLDLKTKAFAGGDEAAALAEPAANEEKVWLAATLDRYRIAESIRKDDYSSRFELNDALWFAGVIKDKDALKTLRKYESDAWSGSSTMGGGTIGSRLLNTRQIAHLSLRRLGEVPGAPGAIILMDADESQTRSREELQLKSDLLPAARAANVEKVKEGMTAKELVAVLGCPDFRAGEGFQYDVDAEKPFTLEVVIDEAGKVTSVKRLGAAWLNGLTRDNDLAR